MDFNFYSARDAARFQALIHTLGVQSRDWEYDANIDEYGVIEWQAYDALTDEASVIFEAAGDTLFPRRRTVTAATRKNIAFSEVE